MTCVHKIKWSVKRPEDCRFRLSVSHYKDRIVAPDEYSGATTVTPSDSEQVLPTKDKLVGDDITVNPAPTEYLSTDHNGTFTPSSGKVGFSQVDVDVQPDLRPLSVSENGSYQPDGFDGYKSVVVDVPAINFPSYYDDVVLPSEYQRVEYIESSGTQYINLPYGFYPTDRVYIKGANLQINTNDKFLVASDTWNNNNNRFALFGSHFIGGINRQIYTIGYGAEATGITFYGIAVFADSATHKIAYVNKMSTIDNGLCAVGVANVVFGAETTNLKLFYGYNSNTAGKICYYVHEKADGRKLALYACYRKSDGVIGMYDVENDIFYTNDGTGTFAKGQDI